MSLSLSQLIEIALVVFPNEQNLYNKIILQLDQKYENNILTSLTNH